MMWLARFFLLYSFYIHPTATLLFIHQFWERIIFIMLANLNHDRTIFPSLKLCIKHGFALLNQALTLREIK